MFDIKAICRALPAEAKRDAFEAKWAHAIRWLHRARRRLANDCAPRLAHEAVLCSERARAVVLRDYSP
jgi:hypothetical protein